ncbi:MAG: hypothetical protein DRI57_05485 [Deltaproteobacteria bacterium]|nr:MAG: hypothetical protein DRI57_05485 [Deltaproteobacteria bacterium]
MYSATQKRKLWAFGTDLTAKSIVVKQVLSDALIHSFRKVTAYEGEEMCEAGNCEGVTYSFFFGL